MEKGKRACHWRMSISRAIVEVAVTPFPPFKIGSGFHALMLSLQLSVSFLPPGRFFPPQHMVGLTVLTYLLSLQRIFHSRDPPSFSPAPFLLYLIFSLLLDPGEASAGPAGGAALASSTGRARSSFFFKKFSTNFFEFL